MLDAPVRKIIDPPLNSMGRGLARIGVSANMVTVAGFGLGLVAVGAVALGAYEVALVFLLLNRLADGLDGAVARATHLTLFGGYLDIVADFLIWGLLPVAFAIARPDDALVAAFLLSGFIGAMVTFLAYSIMAAARGEESDAQGQKSLYYLEGLTEGTETILFFVIVLLLPGSFQILGVIFALMTWITTASRVTAAWRRYGVRNSTEDSLP